MSIKKGLNAIHKLQNDQEARYQASQGNSTRTKWFSLPKDKDSAKVIFLQELDADSANYSQKNDLGFLAVEHASPKDFKRKALCSLEDQGSCYGCEEHRKDWKAGWKPKTRLYINVLVDNGNDEPFVAVLSQGTSDKAVTPALIEQAGEIGTITDKWFKIKRSGQDFNNTSYLLTPLGAHDKNVEDFELFDLDNVVREIPYAQQEAHYLGGEQTQDSGSSETKEAETSSSAAGSTDTSETW